MALVSKNFGDIITFTRASTATYFDSAGVLQSAAIDTPRFDYDPATLAARGLLIEEQRTNLCLASEDLFQTGTGGVNWIWPAGVVTGNTEVAPDGTTTADTVTSSGGVQNVYQSITVTASTAYTFSVFVKLGTMSAADYKIAFYNNTAAAFIATDIVPTQVPNTSGWTRINYTFTTPVGCTSVRVYPFRNNATIPSSTVFIWGAQMEAGAFPTSYIPTTTTALTRSADVASVNTLSPWFNATESTLYVEAVTPPNLAGFPTVATLSDGSTANQISHYLFTSGYYANVRSGGAVQGDPSRLTAPVVGNVYKFAVALQLNDAIAAANGLIGVQDTSLLMPVGVNQMRIGASATGGAVSNTWIRRLTYFPRRLSNAELQGITS